MLGVWLISQALVCNQMRDCCSYINFLILAFNYIFIACSRLQMSTHTETLLWRLGVCVMREQMSPMMWCKEICQLNAIFFRLSPSLSPPFFYFNFQFPIIKNSFMWFHEWAYVLLLLYFVATNMHSTQNSIFIRSGKQTHMHAHELCHSQTRTNMMLFKILPQMQLHLSKYVSSRRTKWCSAYIVNASGKSQIEKSIDQPNTCAIFLQVKCITARIQKN